MALTYKKLSELSEITQEQIDSTTKIPVTTGSQKANKNLKITDLIADDLVTNNEFVALSARQGTILDERIDSIKQLPEPDGDWKYLKLVDGGDISWANPYNALDSVSVEDGPLDARQGKVLKDYIDNKISSNPVMIISAVEPVGASDGDKWFSLTTGEEFNMINGIWITD